MVNTTKKLAINQIHRDGGTQSRVSLNESTILEYVEILESGVDFDAAIVAFYDGTDYWLADGFHRCAAYERYDAAKIDVDVKQGTLRDAVLYSVGANAKHGLPRTNADKRRAVELLLRDEEWSAKSDRWIAETCGVGKTLVLTMRSELVSTTSSVSRAGQDGVNRSPRGTATAPGAERKRNPENAGVAAPLADLEPSPKEPTRCPDCGVSIRIGCCCKTTADPGPEPKAESAPPVPMSSRLACLRNAWDQADDECRAAFLGEVEAMFMAPLDELTAERTHNSKYDASRKALRGNQIPGERMIALVLDGGERAMALLGLGWGHTLDDLKKAWKRASLEAHPDRGGSHEKQSQINQAHALLEKWHDKETPL